MECGCDCGWESNEWEDIARTGKDDQPKDYDDDSLLFRLLLSLLFVSRRLRGWLMVGRLAWPAVALQTCQKNKKHEEEEEESQRKS